MLSKEQAKFVRYLAVDFREGQSYRNLGMYFIAKYPNHPDINQNSTQVKEAKKLDRWQDANFLCPTGIGHGLITEAMKVLNDFEPAGMYNWGIEKGPNKFVTYTEDSSTPLVNKLSGEALRKLYEDNKKHTFFGKFKWNKNVK